jgi:hypothetical protein
MPAVISDGAMGDLAGVRYRGLKLAKAMSASVATPSPATALLSLRLARAEPTESCRYRACNSRRCSSFSGPD